MKPERKAHGFSQYPRWFTYVLTLCLVFLVATGVALVPVLLEFKFYLDPGLSLESDTRVFTSAVHCAAGFFFVFFTGAIWQSHMRRGWRKKQNRISGVFVTGAIALLVLSCVGLYYFGEELWQQIAAATHLLFGVVFIGFFTWHAVAGRRLSAREADSPALGYKSAPQN